MERACALRAPALDEAVDRERAAAADEQVSERQHPHMSVRPAGSAALEGKVVSPSAGVVPAARLRFGVLGLTGFSRLQLLRLIDAVAHVFSRFFCREWVNDRTNAGSST
jgi:hypothetical protein